MTRVGRLLSLSIVLLAFAGLAGVARAQPPEFGYCSQVFGNPGEEPAEYFDSHCTTTVGEPKQWHWSPLKGGGEFFIALAKLKFALHGGEMRCNRARGLGHFTDSKTVSGLALALRGCARLGESCTSSGAQAGEVVISTLTGLLGFAQIPSGKTMQTVTGMELSPPEPQGTFAEFSCGATAVTMTGSPVPRIYRKAARRQLVLQFKSHKGVQQPEHLQGKPAFPLEDSVGGGPFAPTLVTGNLRVESDEKQINSVV
jgi:hypothetical protein